MLKPPVTAIGFADAETAASKLPPGFFHCAACRQILSPWQAADGEQPFSAATRG